MYKKKEINKGPTKKSRETTLLILYIIYNFGCGVWERHHCYHSVDKFIDHLYTIYTIDMARQKLYN